MMVSARPTMKPLSTGSEMKLATNPSRSRPAASAISPVVRARVTVSTGNRPDFPAATSPTAAADSAAVAAIGPTIRCRELPNTAYRISAPGAAYRPTTADTPAVDAYASASGTSTAQTVRPATRSPRSHPRWYPRSDRKIRQRDRFFVLALPVLTAGGPLFSIWPPSRTPGHDPQPRFSQLRLIASPRGSEARFPSDRKAVIASASGSQLASYVWGAAQVILVIGAQKLVPDLDAARRRVYQQSLKLEDARAQAACGRTAT
jgi:hypothetical protein